MAEVNIPPMTIVIQPEKKGTDDKFTGISIADDLVSCVIGQWNFAGKSFNLTLWDENSTPTYTQIGVWTFQDAVDRMIELTQNS